MSGEGCLVSGDWLRDADRTLERARADRRLGEKAKGRAPLFYDVRPARIAGAWTQNAAGVFKAPANFIVNDVADDSFTFDAIRYAADAPTSEDAQVWVVWRGRWEVVSEDAARIELFEIDSEWTLQVDGGYKAFGFRVAADGTATESTAIYAPAATRKPTLSDGERVYAVWRGRWEAIWERDEVPNIRANNLTEPLKLLNFAVDAGISVTKSAAGSSYMHVVKNSGVLSLVVGNGSSGGSVKRGDVRLSDNFYVDSDGALAACLTICRIGSGIDSERVESITTYPDSVGGGYYGGLDTYHKNIATLTDGNLFLGLACKKKRVVTSVALDSNGTLDVVYDDVYSVLLDSDI